MKALKAKEIKTNIFSLITRLWNVLYLSWRSVLVFEDDSEGLGFRVSSSLQGFKGLQEVKVQGRFKV